MKRLFLLLALSAGVSLDSHAQFGDFLKSVAGDAARQAVSNQVQKAVSGVVDSAARSVSQPAAAAPAGDPVAAAAASPAATPAATPAAAAACGRVRKNAIVIGERPESYQPENLWPDAGCPVYSYSDLKFAKATAAKHAFREASKVRCNDCEGGYWPDAWGWRSLVKNSGNYVEDFTKMLVALKEGESLAWKGNKYEGKVTATGAQPIGDLPCRQFRYTLTDKGKQVAEYDSLVCEYTGAYSSKASWREML